MCHDPEERKRILEWLQRKHVARLIRVKSGLASEYAERIAT
jgi:hypothetical protein